MSDKITVVSKPGNKIAVNTPKQSQIQSGLESSKITVSTKPGDSIAINTPKQPQVKTVDVVGATNFGVSGARNLSDLVDVDTSNHQNNDTLVYDSVAGKYVIKVLPVVDGGSF